MRPMLFGSLLACACACASTPPPIHADGPEVQAGVAVDQFLEWLDRDHGGKLYFELWCATERGEGFPKDAALGRPWLERAASLGFGAAVRELAWRHMQEGATKAPGPEDLERLGGDGDLQALFYLATWRHDRGDLDDEAYWNELEQLADRGAESAQRALATRWRTRTMGLWWLRERAAEGDADACLEIGLAFETGEVLAQSRRQAFLWYSRPHVGRTARQAEAMMRTYDPAPASTPDWFSQPWHDIDDLALDHKHPLALYEVGVAWEKRYDEDPFFNGVRLIREAAATGVCPLAEAWLAERFGREPGTTPEEMLRYAECLEYGWGREQTAETWSQAAHWYAEAAARGSTEAGYAHARLLLMHAGEVGLNARDAEEQALRGLAAVAAESPSAACALGLAHAQGGLRKRWTLVRDPALCVRWLRVAADKGHARAQLELGRCYENGYGVEPDVRAASGWYARAAAERFLPEEPGPDPLLDAPVRVEALLAFGRLGSEHGATRGERVHAVHCVRLAQQEGAGAEAAALLARAYETGRGVPRNAEVAAAWRRAAARRDSD